MLHIRGKRVGQLDHLGRIDWVHEMLGV